VNGAEIRRSELEVTQRRLPEQYRQLPLQVIFDPLLDQVINGRLLAAEAKKRRLESRPEVQAAIAAATEEVLRDNFVQQAVETGATPDKLRAAYDALKTQPGFAAEEVHARHVLVASEGEAREVLAQLGGGADFGELAKTRSTDPSAKTNGGDLGYFGRDAMVPEFADAAFTIPLGTVGKDPVQSQFGWHVIKVEDRRQTIPTFEEKEPELREQVAREIVNALVTQIRGGAQVQRFGLDGTPQRARRAATAAVGRQQGGAAYGRRPPPGLAAGPERFPAIPPVAGVALGVARRRLRYGPRRPDAARGAPGSTVAGVSPLDVPATGRLVPPTSPRGAPR
jgi:peptidyl-prolyl cis-trans isomerase C